MHTIASIALRVIVVGVIIAGFLGVGAAFGAYMGVVESAPEIQVDEILPDAYTTVIYDSQGNEIDRLHGEENREYAKLAEMPQYLRDAVVAVEDMRFYTHNGIDLKGITRAIYTNLKDKDLSEGASTITQQLIKNNILKDPSKKWRRKLQEQYIAIEYEKALTKTLGSKEKAKDYILEIYLNSIALGHGNNGVKAAAKYYFNKELSELTLSECATIAAITNNPSLYSPKSSPDGNKTRRDKILKDMFEQEMITEAEYERAKNEDVYSKVAVVFQGSDSVQYQHSYFVDQLITEIARDLMTRRNKTEAEAYNLIYSGGLKINATIDMGMQAVMDEKFKDDTLFPQQEFQYKVDYWLSVQNEITGETTHHSLSGLKAGYIKSLDELDGYLESKKEELMVEGDIELGERHEVIVQPQAAMVIMDYHNGYVKALTGGRGDKTELGQRPLNRATQSPRQPGSVFKVLTTYLPGIDSLKISAATIVMDAPIKIGNKQFNNHWGGTYRGPYTMRKAIEDSANVVTVRTLVELVGLETMWDYLMNLGFTTLVDGERRNGEIYSDKTAAAGLGGITDGVYVMELTGAYGAIANEGMYNKPVLYSTVIDHNGQLLLDNTQNEPRQVLKKQSAYILTDMMKGVITRGTGGVARFREVKMPIAGKTGTTSDDKDLVFAGYTPYYVSAIWMGHDIPKKMSYQVSPHLQLWREIMEEIHRPLEYIDWERPEGIVSGTVCAISGKLPGENCDKTVTDMFIAGTVPFDVCDDHIVYDICSVSGKLATEYCPVETVERVVTYIGSPEDKPEDTPEEGAVEATPKYPTESCDVHTEFSPGNGIDITGDTPEWLLPGYGQINTTSEWIQVWDPVTQTTSYELNPNYIPPETVDPPLPSIIDDFDFDQY